MITSLSLNFSKGLQTLEGVQAFPNLQTLSLVFCKNLQDLGALQFCLSLQKLDLPCGLHDLSVLSHLTQLKDVTLRCKEHLKSFRQHNQAAALESLTLLSCDDLFDLGFLKSFPGLKHLCFCGEKLASVSGVEHCDNLQDLNLVGCESLRIQGLEALKDYSQLENLVLPRKLHGDDRSIKNHFFPDVSFWHHNGGFTVKKEQIRFFQERLKELSKEKAADTPSFNCSF